MDKNILKKFAIESRKLLEEKVADRINLYYVDEDFNEDKSGEVITLTNEKHNLTLTSEEYGYRESLLNRIKKYDSEYGDGLSHVIEEAAFTWFNRIVCLRYMELHDFLPLTKEKESLNIRVLSSRENEAEPEIMKNANLHNPELDIKINHEKLDKIININDRFEYVLLKVCEKMGEVLPQIFDGETDYIELLIPKNLLNADSFLDKLIKEVPENNFNDIEIIGWFYQYYNQSEKDKAMKEKRAYKKSEIPYVTQIFTPDWIVKYMVENSLGRLYIEKTGDESLESEFKYFIKDNIEIDNKGIEPTNITFIDPCMGSGHILIYAFEVFMKLYLNAGYNKKDIPELILKNNLYGLDIDDRAGQFAIISIMLKAREYDKDIFNKIDFDKLNILSIKETDTEYLQWTQSIREADIRETIEYLIETFKNAKEIGSLLIVEDRDYKKVEDYLNKASDTVFNMLLRNNLKDVIRVAKILSKKYDVVVTNPPYLNSSGMTSNLKNYVNIYYEPYKIDLFASFIIKELSLLNNNSYIGAMTPNVWMYLYNFNKLREYIIDKNSINSFVELAKGSFFKEATVDLVTFVIKNTKSINKSIFIKLSDFKGDIDFQNKKYIETIDNINNKNIFHINNNWFDNIPDKSLSYWITQNMIDCYKNAKIKANNTFSISDKAFSDGQILTGNNDKYIRNIWEVESKSIQKKGRWMFHAKGGDYRRWYGNIDSVVSWTKDSINHYKKDKIARFPKDNILFRRGVTWNLISSSDEFGMRLLTDDVTFNKAAATILFNEDNIIEYTLGYLNSIVARTFLKSVNPTLNTNIKDVLLLPIIIENVQKNKVNSLVKKCIDVSKKDWDSFETSWDFKKHPLV